MKGEVLGAGPETMLNTFLWPTTWEHKGQSIPTLPQWAGILSTSVSDLSISNPFLFIFFPFSPPPPSHYFNMLQACNGGASDFAWLIILNSRCEPSVYCEAQRVRVGL